MNVVLATGNAGKVTELQRMLTPFDITVTPQSEFNVTDVPETGTTFVENAIIKARHAARITGLPAIADDSGLEVDALHGAPGIYSARFAGEQASDLDNIKKLLSELEAVPTAQRTARFRCVLVMLRHADDPTPLICMGTWEGEIAGAPQGAHGFGYDPVFIPAGEQRTAAQLDSSEKNEVSHRGQALQQLAAQFAASH